MAGNHEQDEILQQMAQLRREFGEGVDELVEDARVLADWRYYVRTYPWITMGTAAALGYLVVPQRLRLIQPDPKTIAKLAEENRVVIKPTPEPEPKGVGGALMSMLIVTFARSVLTLMGNRLGQVMAQQTAKEPPPARNYPSTTQDRFSP